MYLSFFVGLVYLFVSSFVLCKVSIDKTINIKLIVLEKIKWLSKPKRCASSLKSFSSFYRFKALIMTLSPKLGVVGTSTLWHFRLPLPIQMFTKVASSPRLSGIGMPSPILWSHPLKMQRIVLLSSLLWWELGTNSLITGPGEWLSFRRFTSKLSWSQLWDSIFHSDLFPVVVVVVVVELRF